MAARGRARAGTRVLQEPPGIDRGALEGDRRENTVLTLVTVALLFFRNRDREGNALGGHPNGGQLRDIDHPQQPEHPQAEQQLGSAE